MMKEEAPFSVFSPTLQRYIKVCDSPDYDRQAELIRELETMIKNHRGNKRRVVKKYETRTDKEQTSIYSYNKMIVSTLMVEKKEMTKLKFQYESENLETLLNADQQLLDAVKENPKISIDIHAFQQDTAATFAKNKEYMRLKKKRQAVSIQISRFSVIPNQAEIFQCIRKEILNTGLRYQENIMYSPPSEFDQKVALYIQLSPLNTMVFPIANFIAYGKPDDALYAIGEFTNYLYNLLQLKNETAQVIIYTAALRFLFDESYVIKSDLRKYKSANALFLEKCDAFSKKPAKDLELSNDIESYYTPGLPIASLFKTKQVNFLKQLEYMTNPIDLMVNVHIVINQLAQFFESEVGVLSFDDTLTLFIGLLSLSPPANAISIIRFVEKWNNAQLSDVIKTAKNFYVAACGHLMNVDKYLHPSEDEEEDKNETQN